MPITTSPRTVSVTEGGVVVFNSFVTDDLGRPFTGTLQWTLNLGGTGRATLTDFNLASTTGTVSIVNGVATVRLPTRIDNIAEISERFSVTLTVPGRLWSDIVSGTISEPVVAPTVTANLSSTAAAVVEGNSGVTLVTYTVTLSAPATQNTTISYATQLLTAQVSDFSGGAAPNGSLTFFPGERTKTFTVAIASDQNVEPDESFSVALTSATAGVTIGASRSVTTTITNDDRGSTGGGASGSVPTIGNDNLTGTAGPDSINGLAGNDTISGGQGNDTLMGGVGDDVLNGGDGVDSLDGGEGSDVYMVASVAEQGSAVAEIADSGTAGVDELRFSSTVSSTLILGSGYTGLERIVVGTGMGVVAVNTATTSININVASVTNGLTIVGNAGANNLTGTSFGDILNGDAGNDVLNGGLGNDVLIGGFGADTLSGGDGLDTASYETATDNLFLSLSNSVAQSAGLLGADVLLSIENLSTGSGSDRLIGDAFANILNGGAGNDTLDGGLGNDVLLGGLGSDSLRGGLGDDELNGGDGVDTVSYEAATSGVSVSLAVQDISSQNTIGAGVDRLIAIENLVGSSFNDFLVGNGMVNRIVGGLGVDVIEGGAAVDSLDGGDGSDLYIVSNLSDKVAAEISDSGINGTDELRLTATIAGTLSVFAGDLGVERIVIGTGTGSLANTNSTVALSVDASFAANALTIIGNAGSNTLTGSTFSDRLDGGAGDDVLTGGSGSDTLVGGLGNDVMNGGLGIDTADYSTATGNLSLSLAIVTGQLIGSYGIETITGIENVTTGAGNDSLSGDAGGNVLNGGSGNDTLDGAMGNDVLIGGMGIDTATYVSSTLGVSVNLALLTAQNTFGGGTDTLSLIENLIGSRFDDNLAGTVDANVIEGGDGNDVIVGGFGVDTLLGGIGDDLFLVNSDLDLSISEVVTGGVGLDEVRYASTVAPVAITTALIIGPSVTVERVVIGTGSAAVADTTGSVALNVNAASASGGLTIIGNNGANSIRGSASADTIEGGGGNDNLLGGNGNDRLTGGSGNDVLTGGAGADAFVFNFAPNATSNRDTIADFISVDDTIELARSVMTGLGPVGTLNSADFRFGAGITTAGDATDRIIYNTSTGALYYDADGTGAGAAVQFAQLNAAPTLNFNDFIII